ncbi:D-tyrosyl-tRNA(Tyr) deacylase [Zalaria obscura]|uniref:D-tyrosyl-tRNA(Tyr) deacylase n=1 Tax=Zalaria obscura TaxID=2024903 RepID=A0ACC3SCY2_9PEZI
MKSLGAFADWAERLDRWINAPQFTLVTNLAVTSLIATSPYLTAASVLQRVKSASVTVDGQLISTIGKGILVFAAVGKEDTKKEVESMANKILKVKLWEDDNGGKWKRNVQDINGEVLCASTKKGNKPDFHKSAPPSQAKELYDHFVAKVQSLYKEEQVKNGVFQAMMDVGLVNDGPVEPAKAPNPTKFDLPEDAETIKGKVQQTFTLPASLLE